MITLLPVISLAMGQNGQGPYKGTGNNGRGNNNDKGWGSDKSESGLSSATPAPVCQIRAPLVFSPDSLKFKDSDGAQTFSISLANAPVGPVVYNLNGDNLKFDKCSVSFNKNNWNKPQMIRAIPTLFKGNDITLKFNITATGKDGKKVKGYLPVTRYAMDAPVGSSSGDPHFHLFTGKVISQQKHVVNYLFKSPDFDVMAAQEKCQPTSKVYCNRAVVVRFGDSWYTYDSRAANWDGSGITVNFDGIENPGFIYSPPTTGANAKKTYDFTIPDGSKVSVFPSDYSTKYGVHNTITVSLHPSMAMQGSGALNAAYVDKHILVVSDGTTGNVSNSKDATRFFNSWEVPSSKNFLMGQISTPDASDMPFFQKCALDPAGTKNSIEKPKSYTSTWAKLIEVPNQPLNYTDAEIDAAANMCKSVFQNLEFCQDIVDSKPVEVVCFKDALLTKDITMAQDHLEDYLLECADNVKSLAAIDAEIDKVMAKFGFGSILCPSNCSGNGDCTTSGCSCTAGFHGVDCSGVNE